MLESDRLVLVKPQLDDVAKIVDYYVRNKNFLKAYEPEREAFFYTEAYQKMLIQASIDAHELGTEVRLWMALKDNPDQFIGSLAFANIIMGPFKSCFLGYRCDGDHLRRGYMFEALEAGIEFVFEAYGLHRIEANIMPRNTPSLELVKKLGFYNEGIALKYLQINGLWEDHIHMVKRNETLEVI